MKKTTVTLSLKERYTVGILAKQLHTTRSCVMHKALHVYAKALRYQKRRDKKSHLRTCIVLSEKPFTKCQKAIYELEYVKKRTKKRIIYR